ncbi:alpha-amylase [Listeria newyorkensis]|uniref:Sucrose phosphorylase n=1 Tax=Listeria newyorkensis TaxID=1497681 RepID=A0ABX4XSQ8_9LIST|nr:MULTISPECIES: sugar phosphorylase [Listeria]KGL38151.1 alpha-amylase [Listeriaceae bacterium FSL A5-0209]KGL39297.1 alpha-amylase [Listeria newyorkensis]PNP91976.1 alpha-amylase [Listeria newyorkensis]RQW66117.1 alpha-amylase [Listeria sp. SHR_NRA_18]WAO22244.1 sugar phosphorylase [Listeria newyorkensis]
MKRSDLNKQLNDHLATLFDEPKRSDISNRLTKLIDAQEQQQVPQAAAINEKNMYLITYGDSIQSPGQKPLQALRAMLDETVADIITDVHLLPMFPYTSDDGFSVTDYLQINPELGDWPDIDDLAGNYRLMYDFVANHMSESSDWFQQFLQGKPGFEQAFVEKEAGFDATNVVRPRTSPLFHTYGATEKQVWSTFSKDQVDVNIQDPAMFIRLTETLLTYITRGATSIRLDAIGFLWKESGTTCIHLSQTHTVIQIWRLLTDYFAPNTQIITETNVPHKENISYFGDGTNEAHQVYQFPLPPLTLHAFTTHDATHLTNWAKTITPMSQTATYFNFLASHDGIGMRPTEGILTDTDREKLAEKVLQNGGQISYKNNPDGSKSIYELNINYSDALRNTGESDELAIQKMLAAHHILFSVMGVPAIYYHSLFGSRNDKEAAETSGIPRRINREKLDLATLQSELETNPYRRAIFTGLKKLAEVRQGETAFNPYQPQEVISSDSHIFALKRGDVYCYTNVSDQAITIETAGTKNLLTGEQISDGKCDLPPYGYVWVK